MAIENVAKIDVLICRQYNKNYRIIEELHAVPYSSFCKTDF